MFERRIRRVSVDPMTVLAHFQDWKRCGYLSVANVEGLPPGCEIVAIFAEEQPCRITMHVYHPTFGIVPNGEVPPSLFDNALAPVTFVKLTRASADDERCVPVFTVPNNIKDD